MQEDQELIERLIASESHLQARVRLAAFSAEIGRALVQNDSLAHMLQKCAQAMVSHLNVMFARIWILDKQENLLLLQASAGKYTHLDGVHARIPLGKAKIGVIAAQRKPHLTNLVIGDPLVTDQQWVRQEGIISFAGHPLVVDGQLVGVMGMFAKEELPEATLEALSSVANLIAIGIIKKQVEEEHAKQAAELREQAELLNLTHDTVMVLDRNRSILFWNKGGEETYGFTKEEAIGKSSCSLLKTVFPRPYEEIEQQFFQEGRWEGELIHTRKDGKPITAASRWSLKRDSDGKPIAILEINNDVSKRKKVEEALRESEERWQLALRGNNDGIWDWNLRTNAVFFSSRWKQMLGFEDHEICNHLDEWSKRVHPDDLPQVMQAVQDHFAKKTPYYVTEHRVLCKDGSYKWILDRGQALWDENGNPVRMAGSHTDITDRIRTEKQLRENEAKMRVLLEAIPDLMFRISAHGLILESIPPKGESLKLNAREFSGKHLVEVLPPHIAAKGMHFVNLALKTGETQFFEFDLEKNNRIYDYEARIILSGKEEVLAIVRDISDRKEAERMKTEFIAIVSHELRTPLTSILGSMDLLAGNALGELPVEMKELVDIAHFNAERLLNLINDILDMEKIESGKMTYHFEVFDLLPVIEKAIASTQSFARRLDVKFDFVNRIPDVQVYADETRLMQVLVNLLSNAAKYSPPNDSVIINMAKANGDIRVSVQDHGLGIAEEFRSRIFQKFEQVDSSDRRKKGGTGLGLTISKAIVERHDGTIAFDSQPNKGATFYFQLPVLKKPAEFRKEPEGVLQ